MELHDKHTHIHTHIHTHTYAHTRMHTHTHTLKLVCGHVKPVCFLVYCLFFIHVGLFSCTLLLFTHVGVFSCIILSFHSYGSIFSYMFLFRHALFRNRYQIHRRNSVGFFNPSLFMSFMSTFEHMCLFWHALFRNRYERDWIRQWGSFVGLFEYILGLFSHLTSGVPGHSTHWTQQICNGESSISRALL